MRKPKSNVMLGWGVSQTIYAAGLFDLPSNSFSLPAAIPCFNSATFAPLLRFPRTRDHRFDLPSPTTFGRAVTGVVSTEPYIDFIKEFAM